MINLDTLQWPETGLLPVTTCCAVTGEVLMQAWVNSDALAIAIDEQVGCYWSRSRASIWRKGETSGNIQKLIAISVDCDSDSLVYEVMQTGDACHLQRRSCFVPLWSASSADDTVCGAGVLMRLDQVLHARSTAEASESYTAKLMREHRAGRRTLLDKVDEEAAEVIAAVDQKEGDDALVHEVADLWFHTATLLHAHNLRVKDVMHQLELRFGTSGFTEKERRSQADT